MLDRTAHTNRLGLFGMVPRTAARRLAAAVPRTQLAGVGWLYAHLALYAAEQGHSSTQAGQWCEVPVPTLAHDLRCTPRTVQRHLAWLVQAGVLSVYGQTDAHGWARCNRYTFRYPQERGEGALPESNRSVAIRSFPSCSPNVRGVEPQHHDRVSNPPRRNAPAPSLPGAPSGGPQDEVTAAGDAVARPGGPDSAYGAYVEPRENQSSTDSPGKAGARAALAAKGLARAIPGGVATTAAAVQAPAVYAVRCPAPVTVQAGERTPGVPPAPAPAAGETPPSRPAPPLSVAPPRVERATPGRPPIRLSALLPAVRWSVSGNGVEGTHLYGRPSPYRPGPTLGSSLPTGSG